MKTVRATLVVWAVIVAASWSWSLSIQAATKAEKARAAAKLVEETLSARRTKASTIGRNCSSRREN